MIDVDSGIILKEKTGLFYTNQTGGYACHHPNCEGKYIELELKNIDLLLSVIFEGSYGGWCCVSGAGKSGLENDERSAEQIDYIMSLYSSILKQFKVDRDLLRESEEGWVHIINHATGEKAVFVFINSD